MKPPLTQVLNLHLVADATVAQFVQSLCIVMGVVLLFLPVWTLSHWEVTKAQLLLGILLSLNSALLFLCLGLLLPKAIAPKKADSKS